MGRRSWDIIQLHGTPLDTPYILIPKYLIYILVILHLCIDRTVPTLRAISTGVHKSQIDKPGMVSRPMSVIAIYTTELERNTSEEITSKETQFGLPNWVYIHKHSCN